MKLLPSCKPKRFAKKYRGEICLNCSHPLDVSDKFCPSCSQRNSTKKISFWDLLQELFTSILSYDSKLWQTIKLMFLKPAQLSLEYINGKRTSYTNPFRFFLSVSILFFLVLSQLIDDEQFNEISFLGDNDEVIEVEEKDLDNELTTSFLKGVKVGVEESRATALRANLTIENDSLIIPSDEILIAEALQDSLSVSKTDQKNSSSNSDALQAAFKENKYLKYEEAIEKNLINKSVKDWFKFRFFRGLAKSDKNLAGFIRFLIPKIPFLIFLFIPIYSITYFILFLGAKKTYVDHLVFNFNLSSFLLLITAITTFIDDQIESSTGSSIFSLIVNLGLFLYTYKSIRKFYAHGRFLSFFKTIVIALTYPIFALIFLIGIIFISFLFY